MSIYPVSYNKTTLELLGVEARVFNGQCSGEDSVLFSYE